MKRLTAAEVAEKIDAIARHAFESGYDELLRAADIVRDNLIPQWQDEPDVDGWYWIEGDNAPQYHYFENGYWRICGNRTDGSRVCPVGARPS